MKAADPVRMSAKAKPKAKAASSASKPSKADATKLPPKARATTAAGKAGAKPATRTPATNPPQPATRTPATKPAKPPRREQKDWRGETLERMRALILEACPAMVEERKWKKPSNGMVGVPVWSHEGIVCTGETYTKVVKLTFAHGAALADPARLFNSSLEGNMRRAVDIHEAEEVDPSAFKALIKAAVAHNRMQAKKR